MIPALPFHFDHSEARPMTSKMPEAWRVCGLAGGYCAPLAPELTNVNIVASTWER